MTDFQTINDVVNESVKNSSYIAVVISSCVFIIYTLIIRLVDYFKSKSKNKPLLEMSKAMAEMAENITKLNTVLDKTLKDAERKELRQCEATIELGFKAFGYRLAQECSAIIAHNNIDENKDLIISNLNKLVSTEYYNLYSKLSVYEINEINVASKLKEEWIKEITDTIITIIYDGQDAIVRITQINNRINLYINEYSTYVNNKTFNA